MEDFIAQITANLPDWLLIIGVAVYGLVKFYRQRQEGKRDESETARNLVDAASGIVQMRSQEAIELRAELDNMRERLNATLRESASNDLRHTSRIEELTERIEKQATALESLQKKLDATEAELEKVKASEAAGGLRVKELEAKVKELTEKLEKLEAENAKLKAENDALRARMTDYENPDKDKKAAA